MASGVYLHKPLLEDTKEKIRISKLGDKNPSKVIFKLKKIGAVKMPQATSGMPFIDITPKNLITGGE